LAGVVLTRIHSEMLAKQKLCSPSLFFATCSADSR